MPRRPREHQCGLLDITMAGHQPIKSSSSLRQMLRLLLGALFALACCAPLENDVGKNALQILADHTLITYVHDVQATTRALIAAQGASAKDNFEVKAANATQVISTMQ